eukprot:COSAG06_NODE_65005_length_258_cov_0.641509_1_plen_63_part_01
MMYAGLVIDGVTSVFKRFFDDECELQVLLNDDFASSLWDDADNAAAAAAAASHSETAGESERT